MQSINVLLRDCYVTNIAYDDDTLMIDRNVLTSKVQTIRQKLIKKPTTLGPEPNAFLEHQTLVLFCFYVHVCV